MAGPTFTTPSAAGVVIEPLVTVAAPVHTRPTHEFATGSTGPTKDQSKVPEFPPVPTVVTVSVIGVDEYAVKVEPDVVVLSEGPPLGGGRPTWGGSAGRGTLVGLETSSALVPALFHATSFTSPLGTVTVRETANPVPARY